MDMFTEIGLRVRYTGPAKRALKLGLPLRAQTTPSGLVQVWPARISDPAMARVLGVAPRRRKA